MIEHAIFDMSRVDLLEGPCLKFLDHRVVHSRRDELAGGGTEEIVGGRRALFKVLVEVLGRDQEVVAARRRARRLNQPEDVAQDRLTLRLLIGSIRHGRSSLERARFGCGAWITLRDIGPGQLARPDTRGDRTLALAIVASKGKAGNADEDQERPMTKTPNQGKTPGEHLSDADRLAGFGLGRRIASRHGKVGRFRDTSIVWNRSGRAETQSAI